MRQSPTAAQADLTSAVGEMGAGLGAEVDLEKVPLKYAGLNYTEIWISEAQERMVIAVKPENLDAIMKIFADENVEATVIGTFTGDKKLKLRYKGTVVGELDMEFLHDGVPKYSRKAVWNVASQPSPNGEDGSAAKKKTTTMTNYLQFCRFIQRRKQGMGNSSV